MKKNDIQLWRGKSEQGWLALERINQKSFEDWLNETGKM